MVSQNYYPEIGSAANRMKNIYSELIARGYEVTVLTTDPSYPNRNLYRDTQFWQDHSLEEDVIRIKMRTRRYSHNLINRLLLHIEMAYKFVREIRRLKKEYDFVLATTPSIFAGLAGLFAKQKLRLPLILDVRDLWPKSLLGVGVFTFKPIIVLAQMLENKLYHDAKHILINSEGFLDHLLSKGIDNKKISHMPNSLTENELKEFLHTNTESSDEITIIYAGNIGLAQDLEKLLDVAERMKEYANIRFRIIGYGFRNREIKQRVFDTQLRNVELVDPKNRIDSIQAIRMADIAFVSLVEQGVFDTVLPGKIIDYMSMGKPIVGAVSGYSANIINKACCGYVSPHRSVDELYIHIMNLAQDKKLRMQLGENGYKFACQHYSWKNNITVLTNVLENVYEKESMHVRMEPLYK